MNQQVDKARYFQKKYNTLERFISYFYQIDLITSLNPENVLEIGKGAGIVSDYLKKLGFSVTTCDIDQRLNPNQVGDIRKLPFADNSFDIVTAYEVLEHLPFEDFEQALSELKRASKKFVIISLPYRSTGFELVLKFPFLRTLLKKSFLNIFFRIPLKFGGIEISKQHYWEIDSKKYSLKKIKKIIKKEFKIIKEVRPVLNHYHYFFVLEK